MREEKRLFPAQEKSELVLDVIRKHWFTYFLFLFLVVIMLAPLIIIAYLWFGGVITLSSGWQNVLAIVVPIYLLVIMGLLIFGFVDFYLDVYIITDRRIVDIAQNGLFKRTICELNLRQIQDVNASVDGFFATLLHFGDVHIQTAAESANFAFISIPHPYETSKKILDLHEAYLRQLEGKGKKGQSERIFKAEIVASSEERNDMAKNDSENKNLSDTLTKSWSNDNIEACYSDETCRQKMLEGINRHIHEEKLAEKKSEKEGELKEGDEVKL